MILSSYLFFLICCYRYPKTHIPTDRNTQAALRTVRARLAEKLIRFPLMSAGVMATDMHSTP
jgi:hypothetical protein